MPKQILKRPREVKRLFPLGDRQYLEMSRPLVMGVLNVTPDSFSDGGRYADKDAAVEQALQMEQSGADIIDIGGESTRPGAETVTVDEEQRRVIPVIEGIRKHSSVPISIDTYKAATAAAAVDAGANVINDISALRFDENMADLVSSRKLPLILMHMQGRPGDMQHNPHYQDCISEVENFFVERIDFCKQMGIGRSRLIIDPGIGFGKQLNDNLQILSNLKRFRRLELPLLIGASRKSFIGMIAQTDDQGLSRLGGSIAAATAAVANGADMVRVHDVHETVEALKVFQAIRGQ